MEKFLNVTLVIHPTEYQDYDIIGIGDIKLLGQLSHKNKYFDLIKHSKFGGIPILILDTCDTLKDAISCIKAYRKMYISENNRKR